MTYFRDLDLLYYHRGAFDADEWSTPLRAIGWLEHPNEYPRGEAPEGLVRKLNELYYLSATKYEDDLFCGLQECSLCQAAGMTSRESDIDDSNINIFVPGHDCVFAGSGGVIHYIEKHGYLPPREFIDAVFACPEYGSKAYLAALQQLNGGNPTPIHALVDKQKAWRIGKRQMICTGSWVVPDSFKDFLLEADEDACDWMITRPFKPLVPFAVTFDSNEERQIKKFPADSTQESVEQARAYVDRIQSTLEMYAIVWTGEIVKLDAERTLAFFFESGFHGDSAGGLFCRTFRPPDESSSFELGHTLAEIESTKCRIKRR